MSMHLEFEPHSWYKSAAIRKWDGQGYKYAFNAEGYTWEAYYLNGNSGYIVDFQADTLKDLKLKISNYIKSINERDRDNRRRLGESV